MPEFRDQLVSLGLRLLIAGPLFILACGLYCAGGLGGGFLACALLIAGVIILAFPLAGLLSEFTGSLFYSGAKYSKAPPNYSIAESKKKKGLSAEAMQLYAEIAAKYPEEIRPQIEMLEIALVHLRDPARAARIFEEAKRLFPKPEDCDTLTKMYAAFQSCVSPKPDWRQPRVVPLKQKSP